MSTSVSPLIVEFSPASSLPRPNQQTRFEARWVGRDELSALSGQWEELCNSAVWRNLAFEQNYLLPALEFLADDEVQVLIVEEINQLQTTLVALMPLERKRIYKLPVRCFEVWKHDQCFDATPLIMTNKELSAWNAVFEFLKREGAGLLSLNTVSAEGVFESTLQESIQLKKLTTFNRNRFDRACFRPLENSEEYKAEFTSKSVQKNFRRLNRRLGEIGILTTQLSTRLDDYSQLANEFLELEASGWKGTEGTALKCNESTRQFYLLLISQSAALGKARFLTMRLDGKPVAMLSDLQSGEKTYSYKTAFDESFEKFSPGLQLEVLNLDFMHDEGTLFADSCSSSDNTTTNKIWGQRIKFQDTVIALETGLANWAVKAMPFMQSVARKIKQH